MPPEDTSLSIEPRIENYDLRKGRYGITVSIGKSYKSRSEEGADELGQLFQAQPQLFQILGDIYLKFRDFPGHLEAASRVKKLLPPPLQEDLNEPNPQQLQQQLQQAGQMVEQLTKALDEKTQEIETKMPELQMESERADKDRQAKVEIERMRNETQLAVTAMKLKASEASDIFKAEVERVGTDADQEFTSSTQDVTLEHEKSLEREKLLSQELRADKARSGSPSPDPSILEESIIAVPLGGFPPEE